MEEGSDSEPECVVQATAHSNSKTATRKNATLSQTLEVSKLTWCERELFKIDFQPLSKISEAYVYTGNIIIRFPPHEEPVLSTHVEL